MISKHANKNQKIIYLYLIHSMYIPNKHMKKDIYSIYTLKFLPLLYLHGRN